MGYLDKLKAAASLAEAAIEEGQALTAASDPTANVALHGAAGRVSYGFDKTSDVPDRIEDSAQWEDVRRADHGARDARRGGIPVAEPLAAEHHSRRDPGQTQAQDVAEHLAASGLGGRPEPMYGLYRVPDRINPSGGNEKNQVVEWDFVHAATEPWPGRSACRCVLRRREAVGGAPSRGPRCSR